MTTTPGIQTMTIHNWLPTTSANARGNWRAIHHRHHVDRDRAWASAKQAGWTFVPGTVRLTIVLVYPVARKRDADNLTAKCKGLIDGLAGDFFQDDDTEHLALRVSAVVEPGTRATRISLEAVA